MSMISEQIKGLRKLAKQWKHNDVAGCNLILDACDTIEALSAKVREGNADGDTISRSQAIKDVSEWATDILHPDRLVKEDAIHILESLPSAEQVTGKLNNPDDSLLTGGSEACKEQKSKLDLISRRAVLDAINGTFWSGIEKTIKNIPSAESTGAMDEAIQKYIKDGYMQPIGEDLISRQDAIAYFFRPYSNEELYSNIDIEKALNALPSAPDSRQRGEWVRLEREENVYDLHGVQTWGVNYMCDKCGFITTAIQDHFAQYRWCPSCGARMYKGGEEE